MRVTHEYCDVCHAQVDYLDSDGDQHSSCISLSTGVTATADIRTRYGSSHPVPAELPEVTFCSVECFTVALTRFTSAVCAMAAGLKTRQDNHANSH